MKKRVLFIVHLSNLFLVQVCLSMQHAPFSEPNSIQRGDPVFAPPLYQKLLAYGVTVIDSGPLPPIRVYDPVKDPQQSSEVIGSALFTQANQIWLHKKWLNALEITSYGCVKGAVLHEIAHTTQNSLIETAMRANPEFGRRLKQQLAHPQFITESMSPLCERHADKRALSVIACPLCAREFAEMRPLKKPIFSLSPQMLLKDLELFFHWSKYRALFEKGYLGFEEANDMVKAKAGNPLCDYHKTIACNFRYHVSPLLPLAIAATGFSKHVGFKVALSGAVACGAISYVDRYAIEQCIRDRVASGELNP